MEGIVRTFDDTWRKRIHELIMEISGSIAKSMGGECDLFIDKGYPALQINPKNAIANRVQQQATPLFGLLELLLVLLEFRCSLLHLIFKFIAGFEQTTTGSFSD